MDSEVKEIKDVIYAVIGVLGTMALVNFGIKTIKYFRNKSKKKIIKEKYFTNNEDISELLQQLKTIKLTQKEVEEEMMKHFNSETGALDPNWKEWKYYSEKQKNLQMLENNISFMITSKQVVKSSIEDPDYIKNISKSKKHLLNLNKSEIEQYRNIYGDTFVDTVLLKDRPLQPQQMFSNINLVQMPKTDK